MEFKRFSQTDPAALSALKPDLGLKDWDDYSKPQRDIIWKWLEKFFFGKEPRQEYDFQARETIYAYPFLGEGMEERYIQERNLYAVATINQTYKAKNYASNYLLKGTFFYACHDFYEIFMNNGNAVVNELISFYVEFIFKKADEYGEREKKFRYSKR